MKVGSAADATPASRQRPDVRQRGGSVVLELDASRRRVVRSVAPGEQRADRHAGGMDHFEPMRDRPLPEGGFDRLLEGGAVGGAARIVGEARIGRERTVALAAVQWPEGPSQMTTTEPDDGELMVLPALSALPSGRAPDTIKEAAEIQGGAFEQALARMARAGKGYLVGSYPERDGPRVYHTVVMAGPTGTVLGRYRTMHLSADEAQWATPGDAPARRPSDASVSPLQASSRCPSSAASTAP